MPKRPNTQYFLFDDDRFDYSGVVEPTSEAAMLGYKAVAWNTGLQWTGWWQGKNVVGISTTDPLFDMSKGDISQAVQIQEFHKTHVQMPWLWEANQGVNDKLTMSADVSMPVSWGSNLKQGNFLLRYEDVSSFNPAWGHGQRLWIQPMFHDSQNINRPMQIYMDPYTEFRDVVVNVQIDPTKPNAYFDFSKSAKITQSAHEDMFHFEVTQSRQQFNDLLIAAEKATGLNLQNETGYWSLIQEGITIEQASFPINAPKWGIGHEGAMQMGVMNLEIFDA